MLSEIFHPNISDSGAVQVRMLSYWSPASTINGLFEEIVLSLLFPQIGEKASRVFFCYFILDYLVDTFLNSTAIQIKR